MSENRTTTQTMLRTRDLKLRITVYAVAIAIFFLTMLIYYEQSEILPKIFANPAKGFAKFIKGNAYIVGPFMRSAIVTFSSVILNVYFSSLTAYAIVAYEWKLKTVFNNIVTAFMMLPTTIATIGYYQLVWKFHMTNNIAMLIFPAIATPLTVFFMKLYLQATFSMEIVESGRIAGASEFRIFNQLVLPLLKPAISKR